MADISTVGWVTLHQWLVTGGGSSSIYHTKNSRILLSLPIKIFNTESIWFGIESIHFKGDHFFSKKWGDLIATQVRKPSSIGFSIRCFSVGSVGFEAWTNGLFSSCC
jgi:hypothetical protein